MNVAIHEQNTKIRIFNDMILHFELILLLTRQKSCENKFELNKSLIHFER